MCPSCGTRNVARGTEPVQNVQNPFGVPDLGATAPPEQAPGITWVRCPSCSFRFAAGEVEEVPCPSCSTVINLAEQGVGADPA
jgi:hypothetical protein